VVSGDRARRAADLCEAAGNIAAQMRHGDAARPMQRSRKPPTW
jgi:Cdc6-like AAA superfamily ATPase